VRETGTGRLLEHRGKLLCTTIPLPVKVVVGITPAVPPCMRVTLRTMLKRLVAISNVVEEVNLILPGEKGSTDRVDGRVAPSFIVEPSCFVEMVKVVEVCLRPPKVEVANLEVGPDWLSAGNMEGQCGDGTYSGTCCTSPHCRRSGMPLRCLRRYAQDVAQ
jgi:hypothetical protein